MTWGELIKSALVELGVKVHNEALDASDVSLGIERIMLLLDQWSLSGLINYGVTRQSLTVTTSKAKFGIGAVGDNDIQLEQLNEVTGVTYAPFADAEERPITPTNHLALEQATSNVAGDPSYYFYEYNYPVAYLHFNRALKVGSRFSILGPTLISSAGIAAEDEIAMPPGYKNALLYNLAIKLSASYGVKNEQLSATTIMLAKESLREIKVRNTRPLIPLTEKSVLAARTNFLRG